MAHSRWGRTPYFLHVQDLWPDSLIESGMFPAGRLGSAAAAVVRRIVKATEDRAAVIGVISPSVRELILGRNPEIDPAKIVYVPNPTDESLFRPVGDIRGHGVEKADADLFTLMYVGAIGEVQGLDTLIEVARRMASRRHIRFAIVGDGISRDRLESSARELGLTNVVFHGRVAKEDVPSMMAGADAQLVSLAATQFLRHTTPSKIASLLASEVPIIGHIAGDGATMLRDSGAAMVVEPGDADGMSDAVLALANMTPAERQLMAARGRRYYDANLSAQVAAGKVVEALKGTLREHQH
ncbi:glycosyltransferase family 4 protein [Marisediminicola antarctica]|nr:glycosyltransferase family 4 protein [Marisediminicola antarctica]